MDHLHRGGLPTLRPPDPHRYAAARACSMRHVCAHARWQVEQRASIDASSGARAECDELRARLLIAEEKLAEQRAKVASLKMRAAAASDEVKLTREKMAKSGQVCLSKTEHL